MPYDSEYDCHITLKNILMKKFLGMEFIDKQEPYQSIKLLISHELRDIIKFRALFKFFGRIKILHQLPDICEVHGALIILLHFNQSGFY